MKNRIARLNLALRQSEERYRQLFESESDAIVVFDAETLAIEEANPAACRRFGYSLEEFRRLTVADISDEPEQTRRAIAESMASEEACRSPIPVRRHRCKDGTIVLSEITKSRFMSAGRAKMIGAFRDITHRVDTERELRASEERFRQMAESIGQVFWLATPDQSHVVYVSPAYERIWGRSVDELYRSSKDWLDAVVPEDRERVARATLGGAASGQGHDHEYRILRPDGEIRWIRDRGFPVRDAAGRVVRMAGIAEDISERKRAEERLSQTEAQLHQAQKMEAIGRLAGGVAHDFNNVMTAILGFCEMIPRELEDTETLLADVTEIAKSARRAAAVTQQLLAFSRKQIMQVRCVDLNAAISDLAAMLRRLLGEDIDLRTELVAASAAVRVDPGLFDQVLINLAVNARDAMPDGGRLVISTAHVALAEAKFELQPGPYVRVEVADRGCGMTPEIQERIFEPFFTTKERGKGTGLGLSTVYGIVKQSGGHVCVRSEPGRGTTFAIMLPRVEEEAGTGPAPARAPAARGHETVLLIEDEEPVRRLVRRVLSAAGYRVLEAGDAMEATRRAEAEGAVDLLVTDLILPGVTGREAARRLVKRFPALRVLYLSGYSEDVIARHGVLEDGLHFLPKPFAPDALLLAVRQAIENPRGRV